MFSDALTEDEERFTEHAVGALSTVSWAEPLLGRLRRAGGICSRSKPLLFEVRFAFALHQAGVVAQYEHKTGVGGSTVDFRIKTSVEWLIELASVRASDAARRATRRRGHLLEQRFSSSSSDPAQSREAEMITAQQKIGEKVFARGRPTKFPVPQGTLHVILTDMRGYLDKGGDFDDYRQIAWGWRGLTSETNWKVLQWPPASGRPICGLFENRENHPLQATSLIQERIHFLGFVCERRYCDGEIRDRSYYLPNLCLFSNQEEANEAFDRYPLAPKKPC